MSDKTSLHSYEFIKDRLSKDELVSVIKGDIPGYLSQKIDNLTIIVNEELKLAVNTNHIIQLIKDNTPTNARFIFKRAAEKPDAPNDSITGLATPDPTGSSYGDWKTYPEPDGLDGEGNPLIHHLWMSTAIFVFDIPTTPWSDPIRIDGESGYEWVSLFRKSATQPDAPTSNDPLKDTPQLWYPSVGDIPALQDDDIIWVAQGVRKDGILVGVWKVSLYRKLPDNLRIVYIHKRSATQPSKPEGPDLEADPPVPHPVPDFHTYGEWSFNWYALEAEEDLLWTSYATFNQKDELVVDWIIPFNWMAPPEGFYLKTVYRAVPKGTAAPSTPSPASAVNPSGWFNSPFDAISDLGIIGGNPDVYVSTAKIKIYLGQEYILVSWSEPVLWNGQAGDDAESLIITPDSYIFYEEEDINGEKIFSPEEILIQVQRRNVPTGTITFTIEEGEATLTTIEGEPDNRILKSVDMISNKVKIRASIVGRPELFDITTIVKIGEGIGWTWRLTNENHTFHADSFGVVTNFWSNGNTDLIGFKNKVHLTCQSTTIEDLPYEDIDDHSYIIKSIVLSTPDAMTYNLSIDGRDLRFLPLSLDVDSLTVTITVKAKSGDKEGEFSKVISYNKSYSGRAGKYTKFIWIRSIDKPDVPTDPFPDFLEDWEYGMWNEYPYAAEPDEFGVNIGDHLWFSTAQFRDDDEDNPTQLTDWTEPLRADGDTVEKLIIFTATLRTSEEEPVVPTPIAVPEEKIPPTWSEGSYTGDWFNDPMEAFDWAKDHYESDPEYEERYIQIWVSVAIMNEQGYFIETWSDPVKWNGLDGEEAYSVFLTNENHTYHAGHNEFMEEGYWAGGNTEVRVYKGETQFECVNTKVGVDPDFNGMPLQNRTYTVHKVEYLIGTAQDITFDYELVQAPVTGKYQYVLKPQIEETATSKTVVVKLTIVAQNRWVDTTFVRYVSYTIVEDGKDGESITLALTNTPHTFVQDDNGEIENGWSAGQSMLVVRINNVPINIDSSLVSGGIVSLGSPVTPNTFGIVSTSTTPSISPEALTFNLIEGIWELTTTTSVINPTGIIRNSVSLTLNVEVMSPLGEITTHKITQNYTRQRSDYSPFDWYTTKHPVVYNEDSNGVIEDGYESGWSVFRVFKGTRMYELDSTKGTEGDEISLGNAVENKSYSILQHSASGTITYTLEVYEDPMSHYNVIIKPTFMGSSTANITFIISIRDDEGQLHNVTWVQSYIKISSTKSANFKFFKVVGGGPSDPFIEVTSINVGATVVVGEFTVPIVMDAYLTGYNGEHINNSTLIPYSATLATNNTWRLNGSTSIKEYLSITPASVEDAVKANFTATGGYERGVFIPNLGYGFGHDYDGDINTIICDIELEYKNFNGTVETRTASVMLYKLPAGNDGKSTKSMYTSASPSAPPTIPDPEDPNPSGWSTTIPPRGEEEEIFIISSRQLPDGSLETPWNIPVQFTFSTGTVTAIENVIEQAFNTLLAEITAKLESLEQYTQELHDDFTDLKGRVDNLE